MQSIKEKKRKAEQKLIKTRNRKEYVVNFNIQGELLKKVMKAKESLDIPVASICRFALMEYCDNLTTKKDLK